MALIIHLPINHRPFSKTSPALPRPPGKKKRQRVALDGLSVGWLGLNLANVFLEGEGESLFSTFFSS